MTATVSGALLASGEVFGILAIAVMGKSGFAYIKNRAFGFLKQFGPPKAVSRRRYSIGLIMFLIPIFIGWLGPYFGEYIPSFTEQTLVWAIAGDVLFLVGLFVLGGDFWDKLRSLFIHDARATFPEKPAASGLAGD